MNELIIMNIYFNALHEYSIQQIRFFVIMNKPLYKSMLINSWLKYQLM